MMPCNSLYLKYAKVIFIVGLLAFTFGCTTKTKYKYFDQLKKYTSLQHGLDLNSFNGSLLIIPVGGCAPCVKEALELAVNLNDQMGVKVLLLADSPKKYLPYQSLIKKISVKNLFIENEGKHNYYELGIFSPVIIKVKSNRLIYYQELNTQNIHEVTHEVFGF
jgi:hypothetical protein